MHWHAILAHELKQGWPLNDILLQIEGPLSGVGFGAERAMELMLQLSKMPGHARPRQTNQAINNYNQQGGDLQQRQMEEARAGGGTGMLERECGSV